MGLLPLPGFAPRTCVAPKGGTDPADDCDSQIAPSFAIVSFSQRMLK
jgi:hypothetical protein